MEITEIFNNPGVNVLKFQKHGAPIMRCKSKTTLGQWITGFEICY